MTASAASSAWIHHLRKVNSFGAGAEPRMMTTKELVGTEVVVNMEYPIVYIPFRKLSYKFMAAEALWILSGSNELSFHPEINNKLRPYSDDGKTLAGAYGPRFLEDLSYVVGTLKRDPSSRQAVVSMWTGYVTPSTSKDVPCTLALQFLVRNDKLETCAYMRSSDVWMGLPYDIFSFTMMTAHVAKHLGIEHLGTLRIYAGSSHLYGKNQKEADELLSRPAFIQNQIRFVLIGDEFQWLRTIADSQTNQEAFKLMGGGSDGTEE